MGNPRLLVAYTFGVALVVGAVVALATGSWWALLIAVAVHLCASAFFLTYTFRRLEQGDKPDPVTEAHADADAGDRAANGSGGLTKSGRRDDREIVL
jgi:membrane protein implicated in regulation of membrane protease activity